MKTYLLVCTRGYDRLTFAVEIGEKISPMLEHFGTQEAHTPQDAYNNWAKKRGLNFHTDTAIKVTGANAYQLKPVQD